ncbi:MAG TPA: hypothetical protein VIA06_16930 [Candidatus Dormibacteraeota bacterium]|jgi:hypothetical protein|nr:hypothetical protein [Candidatus Dormibacteraeota bacterium]
MRRPPVPVLLAAAVSLLVAGCSVPFAAPSSSPAARASCSAPWRPSSAPSAQLTSAEAEAVVHQWWDATDAAGQKLQTLSCGVYESLDDGPELAISSTADAIQRQIHRPFQKASNPIEQLEVVVPSQARYPQWFLAGVEDHVIDQSTGAVTQQQELDFLVFVRQSATARWRDFSETTINDASLGPFAEDQQGYVTGSPGPLAQSPSALPGEYMTFLRSAGRQNQQLFAPGDQTTGLTPDLSPQKHVYYTYSKASYPEFVLPRAGGGALVIFEVLWHSHLHAGQGNCYNDDDGKMPVYFPPGRWNKIEVDSVMLRYAVVPKGHGPVSLYGDNSLVLSQGFDAC